MSSQKILRTFFVLLCFTLARGPFAAAEDPRYLAAYHSEYALKLYHDGKIDLAVERFIKALLLDPQNKTAKESLRSMAETPDAVSPAAGLQISRFLDQLDYLSFLRDRYKNLVSENSRLREFIKNNSTSQDAISQQAAAELEAKARERAGVLPLVGEITSPVEDQSVDLPSLVEKLGEKRQFMVKEIDFWSGENSQLRALRRTVLDRRTTALNSAVSKSKAGEMQELITEKDKVVDTQRRNLEYFQNELGAVRGNFDTLQEKFKSTDQKIADLTRHLAEMSMEIFEKNKVISEKDSRMAGLESELTETREKMNLVQRIIQEKDDRIASLEKDMTNVQTTFAATAPSAQQEGLAQLKTDFKDFQKQFKAEIEKGRDKIVNLETQLAQLTQQYQALAQAIVARDAEITLLDESNQIKDLSLGQYRQAFLSANEKVNQLNDMLAIYRGRLMDTQNILRQKDDQLNTLQGTLSRGDRFTAHDPSAPPASDSLGQPADGPGIMPLSGSDLSFAKKIHTFNTASGR